MKKIYFLLILAGSMFVLSQNAVAQKETLTSKTATKSMGYTVLNSGEAIKIYKYVHASHSPKDAEKYAPKYFFIISNSDVLQELTLTNLKKSFPENHVYHDALDANFKEDKELVKYDNFHKMYKINWLLKNHVK
jgi:hypothetical protein